MLITPSETYPHIKRSGYRCIDDMSGAAHLQRTNAFAKNKLKFAFGSANHSRDY